MEPSRYNTLLSGVTPSSVILRDAFVHSYASGFAPEIATAPTIIDDRGWKQVDSQTVVFRHDYQASYTSTQNSSELLLVRATYELEIRSESDLDDEFLALYAERQLILYTRPYFRELLASVAARASIVALPLATHFIPAKPDEPVEATPALQPVKSKAIEHRGSNQN